jgi:6-pyruvoyltetrahydropterin/6-carboxytetrahydropterin synthase
VPSVACRLPISISKDMTTYLTRVVRFSAAHRYHRPDWSDERNQAVFGACSNPHGHGHNYVLEVTVAGVPDPITGFCVDLSAVDAVLESEVRATLDHQHLNHAVREFAPGGLIPTTENLVMWIWRRLEPAIPASRLVRLRLIEEPGLFVDYFGETAPAEDRGPRFA